MQFFKTFLASLLGTILGILILVLILFASIMSSAQQPEPYVRANTVLTINLAGDIPSRAVVDPFEELFSPGVAARPSLENLRSNLRKAAEDDNIAAVWVQASMVTAPWANLQRAYKYFEEYKESGKPLYFNTNDLGMNEKAYYLASLADSIYFPPETNFQFDGFVAQFSFYRGMLEKIGVEPEIFRVGKYKSAVEPFMNESASPESREQTLEIMNAATATFIDAVSRRTGKTSDEIDDLLNSPPVDRINFAYENGLIDVIGYSSDLENAIKKRLELNEGADLRTISFGRYNRVSNKSAGLTEPRTRNKIAVIHASGAILPNIPDSPFGSSTGITARSIRSQLNSVLDDDNVKAIVVHIESPGGAATTSDLLAQYLKEASEKKPVIAAFGNVAASGGYYMAMGADTVVAAENTITGSIGIFNTLFNAEELLTDKLGITYETLKTHEYADLYDLSRPFTPSERAVIQQNIENGYEAFLNRVADGRGMTRDEVHEVAQGRVYTGVAAHEAGLVDVIGDLDRAIEIAAEMAEIEEYTLDIYPKRRDIFETLFSSGNARMQAWLTSWIPKDLRNDLHDLHMIMNQPAGMNWALLPIRIDVD
jgi:protease IV